MSIEAMKQALEALEWNLPVVEDWGGKDNLNLQHKAITSLRQAIAEAEQAQPVALETVYETIIHWDEGGGKRSRRELARRIVDLYTASPSQNDFNPDWHAMAVMVQEQQGMAAEIERLKDALNKSESRLHEVAVYCEQVERDRDAALLALRQAEKQEPVAWVEQIIDDLHALHDSEIIREIDSGDALIRLDAAIAAVEEAEQRYTAPPQRPPWVGLTGDEVNEFAAGCHLGNSVQGAIRKAEAKIKEKNT